jgi:hypothetical protein
VSADDSTPVGGTGTLDDTIPVDTEEVSESESASTRTGERAPVDLPLDQVFEMVKNERRRLAIDFLQEHEGDVTLGELAEHIAAIENDKPVKAISSKERKRVYVGLYQCHLPKMDDLDIIEFNQDRGLIRLGPNADRLFPYIDSEPEEQAVAWPSLYLGLAAVGGVLLVLSLAGVAPAAVGPGLVAGALVCAVGACAAVQSWRESGN